MRGDESNTSESVKKLEQGAQAMFLHHPLDRLAVDTGLSRRASHMAIVPFQEFNQETSLKRSDGHLFGMFEGSRFAGA